MAALRAVPQRFVGVNRLTSMWHFVPSSCGKVNENLTNGLFLLCFEEIT